MIRVEDGRATTTNLEHSIQRKTDKPNGVYYDAKNRIPNKQYKLEDAPTIPELQEPTQRKERTLKVNPNRKQIITKNIIAKTRE